MPVYEQLGIDNETAEYITTKFWQMNSVQTYLIAFTVSDFMLVGDASVFPMQRVYAKKTSIESGDADYAIGVSPGLMKGLETYFGIDYTLPKMDQIALPDFAAGAVRKF